MKIIVDMMGGDNAPLAVLEGAAAAVKEYGVQLIGVGDEALVRKTAADNNISLDGIELVNCTEAIEMCDEPARAIRTKKDSSIVVGLNMLKEGKGDAFVSAWCRPRTRRICCWTAARMSSAAPRCWPLSLSWAAAT